MVSDRLRTELDRFDPWIPVESAWMPPSSWYTDPEIHELELRAVFRRSWQLAARTDQLTGAGDYVAGRLPRQPWLLVRGVDGALRGFHNACRHKGREVVTGTGCARTLVCGYHNWAYDLSGALRMAPRLSGIEGFDRASVALPPMRVDCWGPWTFVNGDDDAAALADRLGELTARMERSRWTELRYAGSRSWTIECNWKVYVDNFLDGGYHVPYMHPTLDAQLDMGSYRTELFEEFSIQSARARAGPDERIKYEPSRRIGERGLYAWIYPNLMINRYGPCLDSNHVVPLGPDRCRVDYDFFFAAEELEAGESFVQESLDQADVTQREDIEICESVQVGLQSDAYDRGRYAPSVEMGEHHFHRLLHRDMTAAL